VTQAELLKLGSEQLLDMALSGELRGRHVWVAFKGAKVYREAMASGDIAPEAAKAARAGKCAACPLCTDHPKEQVDAIAHYCGEPFEEKGHTCGCLVGITVGGQMHPAGKTEVASEHCWAGVWGATEREEP
jgi:hypothetical protein